MTTQTDPFFEGLEEELAPYTDEQVDSMLSATESDLRYRSEIWLLYALAVILPISVVLFGMYLLNEFQLGGIARIIGFIAILGMMWGAIRLLNRFTARYARWRYQSSFLRQLAQVRSNSGR
ncbi:hypothetical protein [Luteimonas vadosa]|uniref:Uncharacterized protein n=1 Tax=Luteimonas vadosa TaxID=1165507 RepID=A0ABP9E7U7_9GAMM